MNFDASSLLDTLLSSSAAAPAAAPAAAASDESLLREADAIFRESWSQITENITGMLNTPSYLSNLSSGNISPVLSYATSGLQSPIYSTTWYTHDNNSNYTTFLPRTATDGPSFSTAAPAAPPAPAMGDVRHPALTLSEIQERYPAMNIVEKQDCAICFEPMRDQCRELQCCHTFCKPCIDKWLQKRACCPLCMREQ